MASTGSQGSQVFGPCAFQVTKEERLSLQFEFPHWRDNRVEISVCVIDRFKMSNSMAATVGSVNAFNFSRFQNCQEM